MQEIQETKGEAAGQKEEELLSVVEAADALGVTTESVYIALKQNRLTAARTRPTLITRAAIAAYAATLGQRNGWNARQTKKAPRPDTQMRQEEGLE